MESVHISRQGEVSLFFSHCGGNLGYILELRWGWAFKSRVCTARSGVLSSYGGHLRNLPEAWHCKREASRGEAGDPGSHSRCHRDIGIPINFQEESGIIAFWSIELRVTLVVSKGYEASCPDEVGTYSFL